MRGTWNKIDTGKTISRVIGKKRKYNYKSEN